MYAGSLLGLEDRAMTASWHVPVSQHLKSGLSVPSWSLLGLWMPRRREKKIARCSTATEGPSPSHWPTKPGELSVFLQKVEIQLLLEESMPISLKHKYLARIASCLKKCMSRNHALWEVLHNTNEKDVWVVIPQFPSNLKQRIKLIKKNR